jgi:uncharacterized membrane protein YphA (DoxX/SURF4 family)
MNLDPFRMVEVVAAVLILGAGIWMYRRKASEGDTTAEDRHYDTQGAVLLLVVAVIMAIHGLGGLDYRPSASELDMARGLASMGQHR